MDVEVAARPVGGTRFGKALALLVGLVAVAGAVFATVELDASKNGERAQFTASRISVDLYGRQTASQIVTDAQHALAQRATSAAIDAGIRRDRAAVSQPPDRVGVAMATADLQVSTALAGVAASLADRPGPGSGIDAPTLAAITSGELALEGLQGRLVQQLRLATHFGVRRSRAVLALSLIALAGVLAGLAAVIGADNGGWAPVALSATALVAACAWGISAALG